MLFREGDYLPLAAEESEEGGEERIVAFMRNREGSAIVAMVPRLVSSLPGLGDALPLGPLWGTHALRLPADVMHRRFLNIFTQERIEAVAGACGARLRLADAFARFPAAVLYAL